MKPRIYLNWWKMWACGGWMSGDDFRLFSLNIKIYDPELDYGFLFSLQITKFCIEFGIDLEE